MPEATDPSPQNPRIRWLPRLRFSLRTLVILVLLIGSGGGLWWRWKPWIVERVLWPTHSACQAFPNQIYGDQWLPMWANGSAYLYNLADGSLHKEFKDLLWAGGAPKLNLFAWRDGSGETLRIFRADSLEERIVVKSDPGECIWRADFLPSGTMLLTYGIGNPVLWNAKTGQRLFTLGGAKAAGFSHADYSPDGQSIVTNGGDDIAHVWDAANGKELRSLKGHSGKIAMVAFSPDGRWIVSASADQTARVWDSTSGNLAATLNGFNETDPALVFPGVQEAYFSRDGKHLVTLTEHSLTIWDAEQNFAKLKTIVVPSDSAILTFSFQAQRMLASKDSSHSGDGEILVYDTETGTPVDVLKGHKGWVESAYFFADGERIVSGCRDGTVRVWRKRRPEYRAGVIMLPEFWLTALFAGGAGMERLAG